MAAITNNKKALTLVYFGSDGDISHKDFSTVLPLEERPGSIVFRQVLHKQDPNLLRFFLLNNYIDPVRMISEFVVPSTDFSKISNTPVSTLNFTVFDLVEPAFNPFEIRASY